jgi:hypothetical protein
MRTKIITGIAVLFAGCAYRPDPVPVAGSASAIRNLAGTWVGEYRGTQSGRSGSITFIISAQGDSAFGDVVMTTTGNTAALRPVHGSEAHLAHVRSFSALRIDFVAVSDGGLSGSLESYIAPDCNCQVTTTFTGRQRDNTIEGTFVTRGSNLEQRGSWRAARSR